MRTPLRAAVIGLGWAGTVHAAALTHLPGIDLVAVADIDPDRRAAYPGLYQTADVCDLLTLDLDYCVVATPTGTHEAIGLTLAASGINAIIEKPLAATLSGARRLVDAFDRAGLIATVGHTERRNPAISEAAARLHAGDFGTLYAITTRRHSPYPERIHDVGVVRDIAIHDVDLVTWLSGSPITALTAHTLQVSGRPHEDFATIDCTLASGALATIEVSRIAPYKERVLTLFTTAGCISVDALTRTITHHTNADLAHPGNPHTRPPETFPGMNTGPVLSWQVDGLAPFAAQNAAFRDALLGLPHDLVTLAEGAAAVAATDAILAAARTGTRTRPAPEPVALITPVPSH